MIKAILFFFAFLLVSLGYSQTYLGKTKKEIKEIALKSYEEVEIISEDESSMVIKCNQETNEFTLKDDLCVKFSSVKSYDCECLAADMLAYNEKLISIGTMLWTNKDRSKIYQIKLNKDNYIVTIDTDLSDNPTIASN